MAGLKQHPPRLAEDVDPAVARLLHHRYENLHGPHPVAAEEIARRILGVPATTSESRNLAARITRFFRAGIGASSASWAYFDWQIRLGFPVEEQEAEIKMCGLLYRAAFPAATDYPPPGSPHPADGGMAPTGVPAATGLLAGGVRRELSRIFEETLLLLDEDGLFNPCRRKYADLRTRGPLRGRRGHELAVAIDNCERRIANVRSIVRAGEDRARRKVFEAAAAEHLRMHGEILLEGLGVAFEAIERKRLGDLFDDGPVAGVSGG